MAQVEVQDKQAIYYIYNVGTQTMNLKTFYKALNKLLDVFYKVIYNICSIAYNTPISHYKSLYNLYGCCFVEPYRAFTNVRILQYTFQYLFVQYEHLYFPQHFPKIFYIFLSLYCGLFAKSPQLKYILCSFQSHKISFLCL